MFVLSYMYFTFWNFRRRLVRLYVIWGRGAPLLSGAACVAQLSPRFLLFCLHWQWSVWFSWIAGIADSKLVQHMIHRALCLESDLAVFPYFNRVPRESNWADGPSRERWYHIYLLMFWGNFPNARSSWQATWNMNGVLGYGTTDLPQYSETKTAASECPQLLWFTFVWTLCFRSRLLWFINTRGMCVYKYLFHMAIYVYVVRALRCEHYVCRRSLFVFARFCVSVRCQKPRLTWLWRR